MSDTVKAAQAIGEAMRVLVDAGVTDHFAAINAALTVTPAGGTPERLAILEALR